MSLGANKPTSEKFKYVVYVDNGVIQLRESAEEKGGLFFKALQGRFPNQEVVASFSPLFWLELTGINIKLISDLDNYCKKLPELKKPENLAEWFAESLKRVQEDFSHLPQDIAIAVQTRLKQGLQGYVMPYVS